MESEVSGAEALVEVEVDPTAVSPTVHINGYSILVFNIQATSSYTRVMTIQTVLYMMANTICNS